MLIRRDYNQEGPSLYDPVGVLAQLRHLAHEKNEEKKDSSEILPQQADKPQSKVF